ncbi:MAG: molybdate ABC transporter substrate-binding protein [Planctomycetota bacterium]|nr:molybdate ABC transporter substrate-binding protein [Planctomycetota bacterium]
MKRASGCALLLSALACSGCDEADEPELFVYAAASLADAMEELADRYHERTGTEVLLNLGSSGKLAIQIEMAGKADVFLSAGDEEMDRLEELGLIEPGTRGTLLSNQLVVIVPAGGRQISGHAELTGDWLKRLAIAEPESVPAGRYAKAWLQQAGIWDAVADRVMPGVHVRSALAAVEHGGAEAGIVYRTDAAASDGIEVVYVVPLAEGPRIAYPLAALADRPRLAESLRFIEFLGEPESRAVFERYGFLVHDS